MTQRLCALCSTAVQSMPNSSPSPECFCQRYFGSLSTVTQCYQVKPCICLNVGGGFSNNMLCHLILFILQLSGRLLCLLLHSPRALCFYGPLGEEDAHVQLGIVPDQQHITGWNCADRIGLFYQKQVSAEDSLIAALSLVHCSSFTLAHPSCPYLLESESYNCFAARGQREEGGKLYVYFQQSCFPIMLYEK